MLCNIFIKASIAIFLMRILTEKLHKRIIMGIIIVTELYSAFFFLLFVLQCKPTSYFWNRYIPELADSGHCIDAHITSNAFYGYSAVSCLCDWTFTLLPIVVVMKLQMSKSLKLSVAGILAGGAM